MLHGGKINYMLVIFYMNKIRKEDLCNCGTEKFQVLRIHRIQDSPRVKSVNAQCS